MNFPSIDEIRAVCEGNPIITRGNFGTSTASVLVTTPGLAAQQAEADVDVIDKRQIKDTQTQTIIPKWAHQNWEAPIKLQDHSMMSLNDLFHDGRLEISFSKSSTEFGPQAISDTLVGPGEKIRVLKRDNHHVALCCRCYSSNVCYNVGLTTYGDSTFVIVSLLDCVSFPHKTDDIKTKLIGFMQWNKIMYCGDHDSTTEGCVLDTSSIDCDSAEVHEVYSSGYNNNKVALVFKLIKGRR